MKKKRSAVRRLQKFANNDPMMINVWCVNGLCEGEIFRAAHGSQQMRIITPANNTYKMAIYSITDKLTATGEYAAIFLRGVPR